MQNAMNNFKSALFAGDFYLAENIGLIQIQKQGECPHWLNELGILYLIKGELPEALRFFDRAIASDSNFIEAQFNAAILLGDLGFYEEAGSRFLEACKQEGSLLAEKHFDMSLFYQSVRRFCEAEEALQKAFSLHPSFHYVLSLARLYLEQEKYHEAFEEIEKVLANDPHNTEAQNLRDQCVQFRENVFAQNEVFLDRPFFAEKTNSLSLKV